MTTILMCDCRDRMHGYGMGDISHAVRSALTSTRVLGADIALLHEAGWDGVVEHLLTAHDHPTMRDLINAAHTGIYDDTQSWRHHHGNHSTGDRYAAYWHVSTTTSAVERLIDNLATRQVGQALTADEADILLAASIAGAQGVATARKLPYSTVTRQVRQARDHFLELWYDGDRPPHRPAAKPRRRKPIEHGSRAGYKAHRRRQEQACDDCRQAAAAYNDSLRARDAA